MELDWSAVTWDSFTLVKKINKNKQMELLNTKIFFYVNQLLLKPKYIQLNRNIDKPPI